MSAELRPCGILGDRWEDMDLLGECGAGSGASSYMTG